MTVLFRGLLPPLFHKPKLLFVITLSREFVGIGFLVDVVFVVELHLVAKFALEMLLDGKHFFFGFD